MVDTAGYQTGTVSHLDTLLVAFSLALRDWLFIIIIFFFFWFVRLLALRPLLAYCASFG
jgi:hypothetical protein